MKQTITLEGEMADAVIDSLGETPNIGDRLVIELELYCKGVSENEYFEGESNKPKNAKAINFEVISVNFADYSENTEETEETEEVEPEEEEVEAEEETEMPPAPIKNNPALAKAHAKVKKTM